MFFHPEHKNTIMKKITTYLIILFLLLMMSSCELLKEWFSGKATLPSIPDTALCTKDANTMEENYKTLKGFRKEIKGEYDNRVISFTNKQMKDNIEYLTAEALKRGVDEDKLGFRVYIAAKAEDEFDVPDRVKGDAKSIMKEGGTYYTTVFFVATEKGESEDPNYYENIYEIPALDHGSSRRPPNPYAPSVDHRCPLIDVDGHTPH